MRIRLKNVLKKSFERRIFLSTTYVVRYWPRVYFSKRSHDRREQHIAVGFDDCIAWRRRRRHQM